MNSKTRKEKEKEKEEKEEKEGEGKGREMKKGRERKVINIFLLNEAKENLRKVESNYILIINLLL